MSLLATFGLGRIAPWALAGLVTLAACGSAGQNTGEVAGTTGSGGHSEITGVGGAGGGIQTTSAGNTVSATTGTGTTEPDQGPYPFVLAHGFFGFNDFAGLGFETYFYKVKDHLAAQGEIVDTPAVDPFNSSDIRGQQLVNRIIEFLSITGAKKVNIIGHSQGGLDARVAANLRPDLVASVVTVSTPHHGTPLGDLIMKFLGDPNFSQIVDDIVQLVGGPLYDQIGNNTSITKAFYLFSQPGITAFNQAHPDSPGVFYASIGGRSLLHAPDDDCAGDIVVPFVTTDWQSTVDPVNALFLASGVFLGGTSNITNDGLVRARDSKWGEYWGCVPADHIDEVGQILGQPPGAGNNWKYLDFYTQLIAYMRSRGF